VVTTTSSSCEPSEVFKPYFLLIRGEAFYRPIQLPPNVNGFISLENATTTNHFTVMATNWAVDSWSLLASVEMRSLRRGETD
jgi:hypothetical protein